MEELINMIVQNGLGIVCVGYMIYFQNTTMTKLVDCLSGIDKRLAIIEEKLEALWN